MVRRPGWRPPRTSLLTSPCSTPSRSANLAWVSSPLRRRINSVKSLNRTLRFRTKYLCQNNMSKNIKRQGRGYANMHSDVRSGIAINGGRVRDLRIALGWSQAELADRVGVGQPTVAKIEGGLARFPRHDTVAGIAEALGVLEAELREDYDGVVTVGRTSDATIARLAALGGVELIDPRAVALLRSPASVGTSSPLLLSLHPPPRRILARVAVRLADETGTRVPD